MKKVIYILSILFFSLEGTSQISLIGQGCDSSPNFPLNFISYKGNLYYNNGGCSDNKPSGIYKTNGDSLGTLLTGTNFKNFDGYPNRRGVSGKYIFFSENGHLCVINGENSEFRTIIENLVPTHITDLNGTALFSQNGTNLWRSDGTEAGTYKIKDIEVWKMVTDGTYAYFSDRYNLWRTDGTEAGTTIVVPYILDENGSTIYFPESNSLISWNNKVFYIFHGKYNTTLNVIDGNTSINLADTGCHLDCGGNCTVCTGFIIAAQSGGLYPTSSGIYFFGENINNVGQRENYELWKSDGTVGGTVKVISFPEGTTPYMPIRANNFNSYPKQSYDDIFYFTSSDPTHGIELWRSDGTAAGTFMVKDINAGSADSRPQGLGVMDGICYFSARTDDNGREIWKSDGTEAGTTMLQDLNPGAADGVISPEIIENLENRWATIYNGRYYFKGISPTVGGNLFAVDGLKHYIYRQLTPAVSTIDIAKKAIFLEVGTFILPSINGAYEGKIQGQ